MGGMGESTQIKKKDGYVNDDKLVEGYGWASFFSIMGGLSCWALAMSVCLMMNPTGHGLFVKCIYKITCDEEPVDGPPPVKAAEDSAAV